MISDFVYGDLYERERPVSVLNFEPNAIELMSLSKNVRAPGYRVGVAVGRPEWVTKVAARNGVAMPNQRAAAAAWQWQPSFAEYRLDIAERRRAVVACLRRLGFTVDTARMNNSGLFVWAQVPRELKTGIAVKRILAQKKVIVSDGGEFGPDGEHFVRLSLNYAGHELDPLLERIESTLETYA